jgi:uncharacterized protein (DUF1810 family)
MTSTQDKYSALKRKYTKLMASYRKISDLLADKNKEIIGGAEGTGDNNNLQQYVFREDTELQELIWDNSKNLPYVENLFQIIDYIFIKFALYKKFEISADKKYISKHFESDFGNWKAPQNADFLNDCVFFLMKNTEAYTQYFNNIYYTKYSKNQLLIDNLFIPDKVLINILEYFGPICSNDDSDKNNSMGIDEIAKIYGFRIVDAGGGGGDGKSFFHSIIYQLSGMTSVTDKSNNHSELRNELYNYISIFKNEIKKITTDLDKKLDIIKNKTWEHDDILIKAICDIIGKEIVIYEKRKTMNNEYKIIRTGKYERWLTKEKFTDKIYLLYHTDSLHYQSLVPMDKEVASIDQKKNDPYNLQRFIDKQEKYFKIALDEIKNGEKTTQWMWFVAPSSFNIEVAQAYLKQDSLRDNLLLIFSMINQKLNNLGDNYNIISEMMNEYDLLIFPDSMLLFECASRENDDKEVNTLCKELISNLLMYSTSNDCDKFKKPVTAPEYFKIVYDR